MTENIENKELIEKYEKLGVELNNIFIELVLRRENGELTEIEWSYIVDTASKRGSELVDYFKVDKKEIEDGFSRLADILLDENR